MTAQDYIEALQLQPHVEGGYYRRIYESPVAVMTAQGERPQSTAIYYLLSSGEFSAWHRLRSTEQFFYHAGGELVIHQIKNDGQLSSDILGAPEAGGDYMLSIAPETWFCAELKPGIKDFCLVSCVVVPGFDFADFELGSEDNLLANFPQHRDLIERFCLKEKP